MKRASAMMRSPPAASRAVRQPGHRAPAPCPPCGREPAGIRTQADAVDALLPDAVPAVRPEIERILQAVRRWADDPTGAPLAEAHAAAQNLDELTTGLWGEAWYRQQGINAAARIITSPVELENILPDDVPYGDPLRGRLGIE